AIRAFADAGGTVSADLAPLDGLSDLDTLPSNELITNAVLDGAGVLQIDENGSITAVDLSGLVNIDPAALYDNFGWVGASDPVTTPRTLSDPRASKTLQIVEAATSNVFEVDFNRIEPGTLITNIPITITEPGNYYLIHSLTNTVNNADGITIDADNVTLDLMGYRIVGGNFSGTASDDGIFVSGTQTNIKIRNGSVIGWDGDGINALNADFSIFTDLRVSQNDGDGLVTDFNCIIDSCTAFSNGFDGLEGDDGTVIHNSTAGQNDDNGIQTSEGCVVRLCASFDNGSDGFDIAAGSVIRECTATDNGIFGFDIALGSMATSCTAYDNMSNGFDMASACILRDCISSLNTGHGVRTFANSYVTDSKFHENDLDGIRISSTDVFAAHNQTTDNDQTGISATASGSLIVANTCAGNLTNYNIDPNCAFGPIIDVTNAGDLSLIAGADHPWANFSY
ncbi:MAG: right-handed parallel beta-helix repeat-containing protein, partial [Acidobacteriota bacterium]